MWVKNSPTHRRSPEQQKSRIFKFKYKISTSQGHAQWKRIMKFIFLLSLRTLDDELDQVAVRESEGLCRRLKIAFHSSPFIKALFNVLQEPRVTSLTVLVCYSFHELNKQNIWSGQKFALTVKWAASSIDDKKTKTSWKFPDLFSPPARAARVRPFRVFLPSLSWSQNIDPTELTWKSEMQAAFALSLHHTRGDVAAVSLRSSVCTPHMTHFFGDFCVDSFSSCILIPSLQLA